MTIEGETDGLSLGNLCLPDPRLVKRADMYRIDRSLDALEPVAGRNRATHPDVLARKIEERHRRLRGRGSLAQPDPKETPVLDRRIMVNFNLPGNHVGSFSLRRHLDHRPGNKIGRAPCRESV